MQCIHNALWARTLVLLFVGLGLNGCLARDAVRFRISYATDATADIQELYVFAGADKISWSILSPGESVSAHLPPDGEPPEITLLFQLAGRDRDWRGPEVPVGVGYDIDIWIAADGTVTAQHCIRPCSLPKHSPH